MSDKIMRQCSCGSMIVAWSNINSFTSTIQHLDPFHEAVFNDELLDNSDLVMAEWLRSVAHGNGSGTVHNAHSRERGGGLVVQYRFPGDGHCGYSPKE